MRFYDGGVDAYNAMTMGQVHQRTMDFIHENRERVTRQLTEAGREWMDRTRDIYNWISQSDAIRMARNLARRAANIWRTNDVAYLNDIGRIQTASPLMQRYMMAEPLLRRMYHDQKVEGYADSYVDVHGKVYGKDHYDYRRVTNEVVMENEETGRTVATNYFEELRDDDRELVLDEKADILLSWEVARSIIEKRMEDPTSLYNGSMG